MSNGPEKNTAHDSSGSPVEQSSGIAAQESKNMALLMWVGTLFFGFIPALILFFVRSDDKYVVEQCKESLNMAITEIIAYVVAMILTFIVIGALLMPVIAICHIVFCIMGVVQTSKGGAFKVPFALRLIK